MYNSMRKLIQKHFYRTAEQAQNKLDVFFAVDRLNDDEYAELTMLVIEVYGEEEEAQEEE